MENSLDTVDGLGVYLARHYDERALKHDALLGVEDTAAELIYTMQQVDNVTLDHDVVIAYLEDLIT